MTRLLALVRLLRVLAHLLAGWYTVRYRFPRLSVFEKEERISSWALALLGYFAIELRVIGRVPVQGPLLLVANHISWLDIVALHAARHCRFVAKADLGQWPLVGTLAREAGTLFIERESPRDALRVVHHMAERLRADEVLAVFPEGTTSNGLGLLPFHANLLQAAIAVDAPVQPVALRFTDARTGQTSLAPCYIGDDTLLDSLWRTLRAPALCAVLSFGEPQRAQGRSRRQWAADLRDDVDRLRAA
ncbi:MAG: 1-acyl-sn-glycerol-3-phosphate acyltransferase [Rhodoferax sp.]|nr:1-acyl-sn-glycerol-3-phosphate acyltransferase [Rhodoferax sp.]